MCRITHWCCCLDLRTGCISISILLFILTLADIVWTKINPDWNSGAGLALFTIFTIAAIGFWIVLFVGALMRNTTMLGVSIFALSIYTATMIISVASNHIQRNICRIRYPYIYCHFCAYHHGDAC